MATTLYQIANGSVQTATISLASLSSATATCARQGAWLDFGNTRAATWLATLQMKPSAAPVAGGAILLYMAWSNSSAGAAAANPGFVSGTDTTYAGPDANPAVGVTQLDCIGVMPAAATAATQIKNMGMFMPPMRYGAPVILTQLSQPLSATSSDHVLTFTPIQDQAS